MKLSMKNKIVTIIFLIFLIGSLPASFVFAQNTDLQTKIQQLKEQIALLQDQIIKLKVQLEEVQKTEEVPKVEFKFIKTLYRGTRNDEVKQLQEFLKTIPDIYPEGLVTGYFGSLTETAVKRFQEKYVDDILVPLGLIKGTGIVGSKTREKLNELISLTKAILPEKKVELEEQPSEEIIKPEKKLTEPEKPVEISCQNECDQAQLRRCVDNRNLQICGNYDSDSCLEWSSPMTCSSGTKCENGYCVSNQCWDGTSFNQCSATKPRYCDADGVLKDNMCDVCGCAEGSECKYDGTCIISLSIFPKEAVELYANWEKINSILSEFDITVTLVDEDGKQITPTESEKEKMRESLKYVAYVLDTIFRGTALRGMLQMIELRPAGFFYSWGSFILFNLVEKADNLNQYTAQIIHEMAHSVDAGLWPAERIIETFRLICWDKDEEGYWTYPPPIMKDSCFSEKEKAFIPTPLATQKTSATESMSKFYSDTNFKEDFAESVTAYVVSPNEFRDLASKYPKLSEKYEFIKIYVFNGREF